MAIAHWRATCHHIHSLPLCRGQMTHRTCRRQLANAKIVLHQQCTASVYGNRTMPLRRKPRRRCPRNARRRCPHVAYPVLRTQPVCAPRHRAGVDPWYLQGVTLEPAPSSCLYCVASSNPPLSLSSHKSSLTIPLACLTLIKFRTSPKCQCNTHRGVSGVCRQQAVYTNRCAPGVCHFQQRCGLVAPCVAAPRDRQRSRRDAHQPVARAGAVHRCGEVHSIWWRPLLMWNPVT